MGTGHFTQVVWKGSKELGIGKATGKKNGMYCTYIVGRYRPPGNFQGKFQQNVARGSFNKDICNTLDDMIKDAMDVPAGKLLPSLASVTEQTLEDEVASVFGGGRNRGGGHGGGGGSAQGGNNNQGATGSAGKAK